MKSLLTAVLVTASFWVNAQQIKLMQMCGETQKTFVFKQVDAYGYSIKPHTIGSWCIKDEVPKFRLEVGNYLFQNLPVEKDEVWTWTVTTKEGKKRAGGIIEDRTFWTMLNSDEVLTVVISPNTYCIDCAYSSQK